MNHSISRCAFLVFSVLIFVLSAQRTSAVEALLLQDTYVDNGTTGGKPPPNASNYGSGMDLRVFKGNGRLGRTFLKFSLATLPPGTLPSDVSHARLRFWVNSNSTIAGSITLSPVTSGWDELTLKDISTSALTFGSPKLTDLSVTSVNNFISIDVTDWVKAWLSGMLPNEGILIEPSAATSTLNLAFDSKESNQTSHEPRLEVSLSRIGPAGPQGAPGMPGIAGPIGPPGAAGSTGPVGPAGSQGPQGVAGPAGTKWFSATGAPATDLGSLSDVYLDLATGDVWQKVSKENGTEWSLQGSIRGLQGPSGADGVAGEIGPIGPIGPMGVGGPVGPIGPAGVAGPVGPAGEAGPQGPAGPAAVWPTRIEPRGDLAMGEFIQGPQP